MLVAIDTWLGAPEFWTKRAMADGERSLQLLHGWPTIYWQFLSNMIHEKLQGVVVPLPQPSKLANVLLRRLNVTAIDFMHIDAAHEYGRCSAGGRPGAGTVAHGPVGRAADRARSMSALPACCDVCPPARAERALVLHSLYAPRSPARVMWAPSAHTYALCAPALLTRPHPPPARCSCKEDVHVWWPLLRHGGILMGDDYHAPFPGVMKAANEFVLMCELEEFFNVDGKKWIVRKPPPSWYEARPQLPPFCLNGDTEHIIGALAWA